MSAPSPNPPRRWDLSYRARLVLGIGALVLLTGAVITWLAHRSARHSSRALDDTRAFTERATPVVEALVRLGPENLALDDQTRLDRQLLAFLQANPGLS